MLRTAFFKHCMKEGYQKGFTPVQNDRSLQTLHERVLSKRGYTIAARTDLNFERTQLTRQHGHILTQNEMKCSKTPIAKPIAATAAVSVSMPCETKSTDQIINEEKENGTEILGCNGSRWREHALRDQVH